MELRHGNLIADLDDPVDISIPLNFGGPQPSAFGVARAEGEACRSGNLIGDTRRGGSCNFERFTLVPHCNGTHTECVGHITHERISVRDCLRHSLVPAVLVSIEPALADETGEAYPAKQQSSDRVITGDMLLEAIGDAETAGAALVVRTLPNDRSKLTRSYGDDEMPPYFSTEAMELIVRKQFSHLVVDLPSIDRLVDEGRLSNHRLFWNVASKEFEAGPETRLHSTITELAYIPDEVQDGVYFLDLQIAPFAADASPSRPLLFRARMS